MEGVNQPTQGGTGLKEQVAGVDSDAQRTLASATESVRGRTGNLQAQLADALDSGAAVLRQRASALGTSSDVDGADGASGGAAGTLEKVVPQVAAQGEVAADLMERGAMWLRENDLSDIEARVMGQLERHPVRTLGLAVAVGFLVAGRRR